MSQASVESWVDGLPLPTSHQQNDEGMVISVRSGDVEIVYMLNDSDAAKALYAQLPLTLEVEPYSSNEMIFYPPAKLTTANTPLSDSRPGSLSYYAPWGDVVMFYAVGAPNSSLYELGTAVSGQENISSLGKTVTVAAK